MQWVMEECATTDTASRPHSQRPPLPAAFAASAAAATMTRLDTAVQPKQQAEAMRCTDKEAEGVSKASWMRTRKRRCDGDGGFSSSDDVLSSAIRRLKKSRISISPGELRLASGTRSSRSLRSSSFAVAARGSSAV